MMENLNRLELGGLTDYCREEFGKSRIFLTKTIFNKSAEIGQFSFEFVIFPSDKGRFGCLLRT